MTLMAMFLVFLITVGVSLLEDSPRELGNRFKRAQKLMVMGEAVNTFEEYYRARRGSVGPGRAAAST